jgi:hypothetical protein
MVAEKEPRRHPRRQAKVEAMQADRDRRAIEQAANYSFRLASVAGHGVVYVTSHTPDKTGNQPIYTVSGSRCNCPDFQHRCAKVAGLECKHVAMARAWLADCDTPALPEPATCSTVTCGGCGEEKEGKACPSCGSSLVAPFTPFATVDLPKATPEEAARAERLERAQRDRATLWP